MTVILVGAGHPLQSLQDAVAAARPHDEIVVSGTLEEAACVQVCVPLTFTGTGPGSVILVRGLLRGGKGLLCTHADTVVRNIEFRQARTLTGNAAGIWHEGGSLTLEDCRFIENQNGLMIANTQSAAVCVRRCRFVRNGSGCGHTHGIYASGLGTLSIEECSFEDTAVGHHVKSRASMLRVERSYFVGGPGCTASYAIDVANGGVAFIGSNQFIKGRNAMSRAFIAYCSDGRTHPKNSIEVNSNIFINHRRGPVVAVVNRTTSVAALLRGNAYERVTFALLGRGRQKMRQEAQRAIEKGVL